MASAPEGSQVPAVVVRGLSSTDLSEKQVNDAFSTFGAVDGVFIGDSFIFVDFIDEESMAAAVAQGTITLGGEEAQIEEQHPRRLRDPKSVYVRDLTSDVSEENLNSRFSQFGDLEEEDGIVYRPERNYAIVRFQGTGAVEQALKASPITIDGVEILVEKRRMVQSRRSQNPEDDGPPPEGWIVVKNLPAAKVSEIKKELRDFFGTFGTLSACTVSRPPRRVPNSHLFAFIQFEEDDAVAAAIEGGNGHTMVVDEAEEVEIVVEKRTSPVRRVGGRRGGNGGDGESGEGGNRRRGGGRGRGRGGRGRGGGNRRRQGEGEGN